MARPAVVDDALVASIVAIYVQAEEQLIRLMAAKTRQGLDAPEWAERRLLVVQEYRRQAERITTTAGQDAASAADLAARRQYNRGHVDAVAETSEALRTDTSALGGHVDTHGVTRLVEQSRQLATAPAHGLATAATAHMAVITNEALGPAILGAATRGQMAQRALDRLADKGITGFTDRAGRNWSAASYTEMAMRTQLASARIAGHTARIQQYGGDLVIVSGHKHGCELCAVWEGKVLSLSGMVVGAIQQDNVLTGEPVAVQVAGTLDDARSEGLFHPNCGHSYSMYQPGVTDPMSFGEMTDPQAYKDRQELRRLERGVRQWKRREAAALTPQAAREAKARTRAWQARIREHTKATGITRRSYREQITGQFGTGATGRAIPTPTPMPLASGPVLAQAVGGTGMTGPVSARITPPPVAKPAKVKPETAAQVEVKLNKHLDTLGDALAKGDDAFIAWEARGAALEARMGTAQAAEAAQAEKAAQAAVARETKRLADEARMDVHLTRLVDEGTDWEEAYAVSRGTTVEAMRREEVIGQLRASGHSGAGFDELSRSSYRAALEQEYYRAEAATNGQLVRADLRDAQSSGDGIGSARDLWQVNENTARSRASEELKAYWDQHGRITLEDHRYELLNGRSNSYQGSDFHQ